MAAGHFFECDVFKISGPDLVPGPGMNHKFMSSNRMP